MKLYALIAIVLSLIALCNGADSDIGDRYCSRITQYSCNQKDRHCYPLRVCKVQAKNFYPNVRACLSNCKQNGFINHLLP